MSTGSFRPDLTSSSAHIYSITDGIASGKSDLGSEAFNSSIKLLSGIWEQQASKSSETPAIAKAVTDAEATLPNLVFFAPAKPKEFSVPEDAFGQFGEEPAKLLRDNKATRISLIGDGADDSGAKMSLLFEFKEPQEINMDPNTGCRKITISNTPRAHISFEPDGTIKLSNISGIRAEVNPGEDPLFGIKPWITVKVDAVTLSKNKDGALEIEVTGSKGLLDHTKTIPVSDEMAKHITALMDALPKVAEASKGDIPKEVREILRKGPEDDDGGYLVPTLIGTGVLALLYALRKAANKEKPAPLDATPPGKPAHPETIVSKAHGMELAQSHNSDATIGKHPLSPNQVKGWLKFPGENGETYLVSPDRERVAVSVPLPNGTGEYIYLQQDIKVRAAKPDWDVDNKVRQQAQSGLEAALPKIVGQLAEVANQWPEKGTLPTDAIQEFGEKGPIIQLRRKQIEGKLGTTLTEQQWQDANYMRGILDKDPGALEKYNECHELRTRAEKQWHAIQSAVAKPLAEMEKRINLELAKKNLPPLSFELAPLPEPGRLVRAQFGYLVGQGKVLIGPEQAVNGINQDLLGSLSHEVKHAEQDSLIIRKYAAEEGRDGTTGKALLERLQARYNKEFKIDLSERYAADILATPGALKLTNDQLKRAIELESAIKAQPKVLLDLHRELARAEKIKLAIDICAQPTGLTAIISSMSKPETLTHLFGTKRVPEDVAEIVQLHLDIAAKKRPAGDWNEAEARRVIIPALQESRTECLAKADLDYRKLFHEQEARCTETDTVDLAKHHNIPPLTTQPASPDVPPLRIEQSKTTTGDNDRDAASKIRAQQDIALPLVSSQSPEVERLAKAKDIAGLAKLAQNTNDVTVATTAVREIAKAMPKDSQQPPQLFDLGGSEGQLSAEQILNKLAKGNSCAAAEAMMQCWLLDPKSGHDLYQQRLANGDLEQLWQQGKLNADRILQHFSKYPEAKDVIARLTKFAENKPELRLELARTLVEPARHQFFGGPFRIMAATNEQRTAAIETLAKDGSKASQDALVGMLKKCTDPILRDLATTELMKHWQSDRVDGTSVCSLLKGNQLLDFVRNTAGMQFSEPANMDQLYSRYQAAKDFYDNGGTPDEMKEARKALDAALQPRKEALKKQIDALTDSLGLPRTKLEIVERLENANGTYSSGKGSIAIVELDLCKNGRITPQLVATIAHEVSHHEQDTLMIKAACDYVLGDSLVADQSARDRISKIYESGTGTAALKNGTGAALTPELLEAVLKQRNGRLSEPERQRANTLMDSTHDLVQNHKQQTILEAQLRRLDSNLRYLRQGLLSVVVDANGRAKNSSISITEETTINAVKKYFKLPEGAEGKEEALRTATDWLTDDLSKERAKLAESLNQTYITRAHEVESHEVSARTIVMTEVVTKGLPTPAALSIPIGASANQTPEGTPKPDPKPTTHDPLEKSTAVGLPDDPRAPSKEVQHQRPADFDVPDEVRKRCQSELEKRVADIVKSAAAGQGWPDSLNKEQVREAKRADKAKISARVAIELALQELFPGQVPTEKQLHDREYMRGLLKESEYELILYENFVKASDRLEAATKALSQPYEAALRDVESRINRQLVDARLPAITLEIGVDMDGVAEYVPGAGKVRIAADQLKGGSLSVEVLGYIVHELKHSEQDALIVRKYGMEAAQLGFTGDELIAKVQERYLKDHHFALDHALAKDIFSKEGALKLTAPELARANLLVKSFFDQQAAFHKHQKLLNQRQSILEARKTLGTPDGASVVSSLLLLHDKQLGEFAHDKDLRRILDLKKAVWDKKLPESAWNDQEAKDILNKVLTARAVQLGEQADRIYSDQLHEQEARVTESLGVNVARVVVPEHQLPSRRPEQPAEPSRRVNFSELTADIDKFGTLQNGQESTAQDFHNLVAKSFIEGQPSLRNDPLFEKLQVTEGAEAKLKFTHKGQEVEPLYRDQNNLILKDGKSIPISEITIEAQLPKNLFDALGNAQTKDQSLTELNAKFGCMLMQVDNISTRQERAKALTGDADLTAKLTEVAKTDQEAERRTATELATVKPMQPLAERTAVEPSGLVGTQTEQKVAEQEVAVEGGLLVVRNTDGTTEKLEDRAFKEIFEASRKAVNERLQKLRADPKTDPNLIAQAEKELAEMKAQQELLMKPTPEGRAFRERFSKAVTEYVTAHGKTIGKGVGLGCSLLIAVNAVCRQFTADGKPK